MFSSTKKAAKEWHSSVSFSKHKAPLRHLGCFNKILNLIVVLS